MHGKAPQVTVSMLASHVKAHLDKAKHAEEKSEQHYISAGLYLKELKARKDELKKRRQVVTWAVYVRETFDMGYSRADELIRIADGRTTVEEVRATKAESMRKSREQSPPRGGDLLGHSKPPSSSESNLFGGRIMSGTEVKKLEKQNAGLAAKALHEQVGEFFHELNNFIHDNYCPRLEAWVEAHPELDDEGKGGLVNVLESCSMTLQQLAQKIDGR